METPFLQAVTAIPILYLIPLLVLLVLAMYLARSPFHRLMAALGRMVYSAMRLTAASVKLAENRLNKRNREVLINSGLSLAERKLEREFERIGVVVRKDLEGYPQVQRKAIVNVQRLEDDFMNSNTIPQALPDWVPVIKALANIKPTADNMVLPMLEKIHLTLQEQHRTSLTHHRKNIAERHAILNKMLPVWRSTQKALLGVQHTIARLNRRSKKIDYYMDTYEKIRNRDAMIERQLSSSALTQFFISGIVLCLAFVGVLINFNLVALPMSEMVWGASYIAGFKTSDVIGMFVVSTQILIGFFMMDALRFTRLFSIIGSKDDHQRKTLFWILFVLLTFLASADAYLALRRDQIAADMEALRQTLTGEDAVARVTSTIPIIGQMIMGFILPFILLFIAIPFEAFVSSARTVLGRAVAWILRVLSFSMRIIGHFGFYISRMVNNIYDLLIFPALWLENVIGRIAIKKEADQTSVENKSKTEQNHQDAHAVLDETKPFNESGN